MAVANLGRHSHGLADLGNRNQVDAASVQCRRVELVVATDLLDRHPDAVRRLVAGNVAAVDWLNAQPDEARTAVNEGLRRLTQSALSAPVLAGAWGHLTFTVDPLPALLQRQADAAAAVGLLGTTDLRGIVDTGPLDSVLAGLGRPPVSAAELGG